MPKKSSSKKPSDTQENAVDEQKNVSSLRKKAHNDIDEIFSKKKKKKLVKTKSEKTNEDVAVKTKSVKKKRKSEVQEGGFVDQPSRPKRRTNDGLTIFTEEELGLNKADAGSTNLCPFDCSCCF